MKTHEQQETQSYVPLPTWLIKMVGTGEIKPFDAILWAHILAHQWRNPVTHKRGLCMKRAQDFAAYFDVSVGHIRKRLRHLQRKGLIKIIYRARDSDTGKTIRTTDVDQINRLHKAGHVVKRHSFYRVKHRKT